ncbi:MAG: hypothetical protein ABR597_13115 [Bacteroidales bacterium]
MKIINRTLKVSRLTQIALIFALAGLLSSAAHRNIKTVNVMYFVMGSDMQGYYQYLPTFFLHDWDEFERLHYAKPYEEGKTLNVYTCGVAIMQAPFFLAAHATALFFQVDPQNGYSNIHFSFVFIAALVYATLGFVFVYKTLKRIFPEKESLITAALLFFATNLYYYTIFSPGMSHVYSFALIAMYIYYVPGFYKNPGLTSTLKLILPLALATLIRPTNLIAGLYFVFYGVSGWKDSKERIKFLAARWKYILMMLLVGIIVFVPQMAYWYKVTGNLFVYSYQSEGFPHILSPRITTVLFGARNGWYIYTPLMFVASLSLIYLTVRKKLNGIVILMIMVIIVYLNASWWAPTFSAAVGYRALIEFLPFMAIPLAFFICRVYNSRYKLLKISTTIVLIFFVVYNILFSYKYSTWLWWDSPWDWNNILRIFPFLIS